MSSIATTVDREHTALPEPAAGESESTEDPETSAIEAELRAVWDLLPPDKRDELYNLVKSIYDDYHHRS